MARRKAPKRVEQGYEAEPVDIFAHFAATGRAMNGAAPPQNTRTEPAEDSSAALLARLDALERQNTELSQSLRLSQMAPAAPQTQTQRFVDPANLKLDLKGLPDSIEKPDEYQRELQQRINTMIEARDYATREEMRQQADQTQQSARLWEGFKAAHSDWAAHEDLVGVVAQKVVAEQKAKGIDTNRYMYSTPDLFYADVAKRLNDQYGALLSEQDEPAAGRKAPAQRSNDPNEDDGRTGGIFGGQESGGAPAPGAKPKGGSDMIEDLQKVQRAMGIF